VIASARLRAASGAGVGVDAGAVADEAEAVGETVADEAHPDGTVAEIVQQGYRFFGGLLRPAKVVVARAPLPAPDEASEAPSP
jgi:hypothetical protein